LAIAALDAGTFSRPDLLPERLADYLRNEIVSGRLKSCERLVEQDIAAQLAVSRVPLREAFRILAAEGLVTIVPHRGAMVSELSDTDLAQLFSVRAGLEAMAARSAAQFASKEQCAEMLDLIDQMHRALSRRNPAAYYSLAASFHDLLLQASGNQVLIKLYNQIKTQFRRYQAAMARIPQLPARSNREHEVIVAAIRKRDPEAAARAAEQHVNSVVDQFHVWAEQQSRPVEGKTRRLRK
jgi:DNA-binding GntR family transcriptional regulator